MVPIMETVEAETEFMVKRESSADEAFPSTSQAAPQQEFSDPHHIRWKLAAKAAGGVAASSTIGSLMKTVNLHAADYCASTPQRTSELAMSPDVPFPSNVIKRISSASQAFPSDIGTPVFPGSTPTSPTRPSLDMAFPTDVLPLTTRYCFVLCVHSPALHTPTPPFDW